MRRQIRRSADSHRRPRPAQPQKLQRNLHPHRAPISEPEIAPVFTVTCNLQPVHCFLINTTNRPIISACRCHAFLSSPWLLPSCHLHSSPSRLQPTTVAISAPTSTATAIKQSSLLTAANSKKKAGAIRHRPSHPRDLKSWPSTSAASVVPQAQASRISTMPHSTKMYSPRFVTSKRRVQKPYR